MANDLLAAPSRAAGARGAERSPGGARGGDVGRGEAALQQRQRVAVDAREVALEGRARPNYRKGWL